LIPAHCVSCRRICPTKAAAAMRELNERFMVLAPRFQTAAPPSDRTCGKRGAHRS
jgi:hypothetical protein